MGVIQAALLQFEGDMDDDGVEASTNAAGEQAFIEGCFQVLGIHDAGDEVFEGSAVAAATDDDAALPAATDADAGAAVGFLLGHKRSAIPPMFEGGLCEVGNIGALDSDGGGGHSRVNIVELGGVTGGKLDLDLLLEAESDGDGVGDAIAANAGEQRVEILAVTDEALFGDVEGESTAVGYCASAFNFWLEHRHASI